MSAFAATRKNETAANDRVAQGESVVEPGEAESVPAQEARADDAPTDLRSRWQTLSLLIIIVVGLAGTAVAIVYFAVNVLVIVEVFPKLVQGTLELGSSASTEQEVHWPQDLKLGEIWRVTVATLRRFSLDLSAVTPVLLLWFFGSLAWNGLRSVRHGYSRTELGDRRDSLPFVASYETVWVQLGLTGTIWGFLIIGIGLRGVIESAAGTAAILEILLRSFGTALLSTFAAVALAYILAPLIIRLWGWIHGLPHHSLSTHHAIETLSQALDDAIIPLDRMGDRLNRVVAGLDGVLSTKDAKDRLAKIERDIESLTETNARLAASSGDVLGEMKAGLPAAHQQTRTLLQQFDEAHAARAGTTHKHLESIAKTGADQLPLVQALLAETKHLAGQIDRATSETTLMHLAMASHAASLEKWLTDVDEEQRRVRETFAELNRRIDAVSEARQGNLLREPTGRGLLRVFSIFRRRRV